jgi:hypothetical protein
MNDMRAIKLSLLWVMATACALDTLPESTRDAESVEESDLTARIPARIAISNLALGDGRFVLAANVQTTDGKTLAKDTRLIRLRTFSRGGKPTVLVLNADTLATALVLTSDLVAHAAASDFSDSAYDSARARSKAAGGVVNSFKGLAAAAAKPRVALTVDMCQSKKPWERGLFEWAVKQSEASQAPFPIAIAMTGVWAGAHAAEFKQLQAWEKSGKLAIEWVNHSMTHPLHCAGNDCAFLTNDAVDFKREVLDLEQVLLEQEEVPSAFFRFPGLVHNAQRRKELWSLGVFGLDADAWLAKGEVIHDGAVILLHGNGNEAAGIRMFMNAMNGPFAGARSGDKLKFVPMSTAIRP